MRKLAQEDCGFEEPTVAMAFVYFEKLALRGKLNKQNRKLCAGACVLLAAKVGSDLKKHEVKQLIDVSELPLGGRGEGSPGRQRILMANQYKGCEIICRRNG